MESGPNVRYRGGVLKFVKFTRYVPARTDYLMKFDQIWSALVMVFSVRYFFRVYTFPSAFPLSSMPRAALATVYSAYPCRSRWGTIGLLDQHAQAHKHRAAPSGTKFFRLIFEFLCDFTFASGISYLAGCLGIQNIVSSA